MRKNVVALAVLFLCLVAGVAVWADSPVFKAVAGDKVYVCACGADCTCNTLSSKPGTCGCGSALVEGKVVSVGEGKAVIAIGDRQQEFSTVGKYACACGGGCTCNTISQKPGTCGCGAPLKQVE
ncbi:MAG: hypothetical protein A2521_10295 [Deltaproteobacteria bacterium RIFOXYD12_FULL_57_12]|nr:MAG: hypothetical protein A2521_10295 [Deltaproteobacteria bacterium RIFOXYD12_FULL_57_12]